MLELRPVEAGFAGVASWWDAVLEGSRRPSPFASYAWLSTWWESYGPGNELLLLGLYEGSVPVGGLALYRHRRRLRGLFPVTELRLVGDRGVGSEGLDFLVPPEVGEEAARLLGRWLSRAGGGWDLVHLDGLRPEAVLLRPEALPPMERPSVCRANRCPYLLLPRDRPVAPRRPSFTSQVTRNSRQILVGRGLRFLRCTTEVEVERALEGLFENHQARWQARGETGGFADARKRDFYRRVAPRLLQAGRLELYGLWEGEKARAVLFGASGGGCLYYLQSGFSFELATLGPGNVLIYQILRDAQARGFDRFDFMKGDEAYKFRWTADEEPLFARRAPGPAPRGRVVFAGIDFGQRLARAWRERQKPRPAAVEAR
jgi:CelD/BcsL family acetyltransferase involved in cellulose biosynthesis